jgi:hypothetical protein
MLFGDRLCSSSQLVLFLGYYAILINVNKILRDFDESFSKVCSLIEEISLCLERYSVCVDTLGLTPLLKSRLVRYDSAKCASDLRNCPEFC